MSERIDRHRVLNALDMALQGRQPPRGRLHPSDRCSQYASEDSQQLQEARGIPCCMSRKGHCWDNAVAERFFSRMIHGFSDCEWASPASSSPKRKRGPVGLTHCAGAPSRSMRRGAPRCRPRC